MDNYQSPLVERYASKQITQLFSNDHKYKTWRRLWVALAKIQQRLGLNITNKQIDELLDNINNINYESVNEYEKRFKHDVMAHIYAYGDLCPNAKSIIHLGATSSFVVDNTDLIILREAYNIIKNKLLTVINLLSNFACNYSDLPTVAFTHFQPAQFTTVGKRACLWIYDLLLDLDDLNDKLMNLRFLGVKGATGTQASFLALFDGNEDKVRELDLLVAEEFGFSKTYQVTGQTYSRKIDNQANNVLSGIAQSAHKFANDIRLLQHLGEIQEPFEVEQIGSSAMPYKRNPMKCERMTSLARFVMSLWTNSAFTAASQWFERTLDDSAGKRIAIPEAFLATDAILKLHSTIVNGLIIDPDVINSNVKKQMPLIATENILMEAVKNGGDRQQLHERIRSYFMHSNSDALEQIMNDPMFKMVNFTDVLNPMNYIGCAKSQVDAFINQEIKLINIQTDQDIEVVIV